MRTSRTIHRVSSRLAILLLAVALAAAGPAPAASSRGADPGTRAASTVMSGGNYRLAASQPVSGQTAQSALQGGSYVLRPTGVLSDTSGCCCKNYMPCVRK